MTSKDIAKGIVKSLPVVGALAVGVGATIAVFKKDVLEDNPPDNYNPGAALLAKHNGGSYLNPEYRGQSNKIHDIHQKAPCLCAGGKGYNYGFVKLGDRIRRLTPLEFERLQTLPDNYTEGVSDTQRYRQCGNGWTVNVISHIFKNLKLVQDYDASQK